MLKKLLDIHIRDQSKKEKNMHKRRHTIDLESKMKMQKPYETKPKELEKITLHSLIRKQELERIEKENVKIVSKIFGICPILNQKELN